MKPQVKKCLAALSIIVLMAAHPTVATAQTASSGSSLRDGVSPPETNETHSIPDTLEGPAVNIEGPFAEWGIPTPPGAEGYEVNQVTQDELNPQGLDEWHPTNDPQSEIVPGQMRSDKEEVPAGTIKADADQAEIKEAKLTNPDTPTLNARPGCGVYWPAPFEVCGAIKNLYDSLGGPTSFLLLPKSNELTNPDGVGKRSEFVNGFIYWHPRTSAHTVSIPVSRVWHRHGWENGFLGYPTTSDISLGNQWYVQHFEGGHVYTHNALPATQASIQGAIYDKWQSMGGHNSDLGFPISDELTTPDGIGRYNVFEGGMIYWTPQHGAHAVSQGVLFSWATQGYERSSYGYPVDDSFINDEGVQEQPFESGTIYADATTFWQPFSCETAANRIAMANLVTGEFDFMCSNRGISIMSGDSVYFDLPTVADVAANFTRLSLQASNPPSAAECDVYEPSSISAPLRRSDYHISKTIRFCVGEMTGSGAVKWSKDFDWRIDNVLIQRQSAQVRAQVNTLDMPSFTFTVESRLQEDKRFQLDPTLQTMTNKITQAGPRYASTANYLTPTSPGTFFVEVTELKLSVPSWGYEGQYSGLRFALGRYDCPQYTYYSDLCSFPELVKDQTTIDRP
ncbi:hypothetical protein [Corynebacterium sp. LK2510]|uniref:hypothetical protein n=1 Tax=Corynebacterium sp. LK2510 TaxID=3110472 RepID=UPI0034CDAE58